MRQDEVWMNIRRRELLRALAAGMAAAAGCALPRIQPPERRRLLVYTKSSGFEHSVVKRPADGSLSLVEQVMTRLGSTHGFDVECTKDGSIFEPERLSAFDATFFYTTGMLTELGTDKQPPMSRRGKGALLDAIHSGRLGFVSAHSASDSFHTPPDTPDRANRFITHYPNVDPYVAMLGGEFIRHGRIQPGRVRLIDPTFPGMHTFGSGEIDRVGEWYSLKEFAPDMHVIMVLDTAKMTGPDYERGPYPVTWARMHGRGRVFYTALGHLEEEWHQEQLPALLTGALRWAFGDADTRLTTNLRSAAPRAAELPRR
jgi:uncharacterized protein